MFPYFLNSISTYLCYFIILLVGQPGKLLQWYTSRDTGYMLLLLYTSRDTNCYTLHAVYTAIVQLTCVI